MKTAALVRIVPFLMIMFLAGCGGPTLAPNQVMLTYRTEPPGAMLYENGVAWGMAPQTRIYTGDSSAAAAGVIRTQPVTAIWPSGAKKEFGTNLPMGQGPRVATISRPQDAPGLDVDMAHAMKLQQMDAARQAEEERALRDAADYFNKPKNQTECIVMGNIVDCTSK